MLVVRSRILGGTASTPGTTLAVLRNGLPVLASVVLIGSMLLLVALMGSGAAAQAGVAAEAGARGCPPDDPGPAAWEDRRGAPHRRGCRGCRGRPGGACTG
jgi:hypothetical protein